MRGLERLQASTAMALALLFALGCSSVVRGGLRENDADAIVVALDRAAIAADKREESNGAHDRFVVEVARDDLGRALSVLAAERLPRDEPPGFEQLYAKAGLVATPDEERARARAATAGELSRSLETWPSVLKARVHLALPEPPQAFDAPRAALKASVLIERRKDAPALDEDRVRALIAGAVDGLEPAAVTVVQLATDLPPQWRRALVRVGPIGVSAGSAPALKGVLGSSLLLDLLLALALIVRVRRR